MKCTSPPPPLRQAPPRCTAADWAQCTNLCPRLLGPGPGAPAGPPLRSHPDPGPPHLCPAQGPVSLQQTPGHGPTPSAKTLLQGDLPGKSLPYTIDDKEIIDELVAVPLAVSSQPTVTASGGSCKSEASDNALLPAALKQVRYMLCEVS
jgi:hypothetical protein